MSSQGEIKDKGKIELIKRLHTVHWNILYHQHFKKSSILLLDMKPLNIEETIFSLQVLFMYAECAWDTLYQETACCLVFLMIWRIDAFIRPLMD